MDEPRPAVVGAIGLVLGVLGALLGTIGGAVAFRGVPRAELERQIAELREQHAGEKRAADGAHHQELEQTRRAVRLDVAAADAAAASERRRADLEVTRRAELEAQVAALERRLATAAERPATPAPAAQEDASNLTFDERIERETSRLAATGLGAQEAATVARRRIAFQEALTEMMARLVGEDASRSTTHGPGTIRAAYLDAVQTTYREWVDRIGVGERPSAEVLRARMQALARAQLERDAVIGR